MTYLKNPRKELQTNENRELNVFNLNSTVTKPQLPFRKYFM